MPKVTEEHKEARREQILVGAQRAFARHGYEGATVARLEEETGLSRGAIFSYFENKQALFIALVRRSSDRFVEIWLERRVPRPARGDRARGSRVARRSRSRQHVACGRTRCSASRSRGSSMRRRSGAQSRLDRLRAVTRDDVPIAVIAQLLGMLANGVAFARVTDDPMPDLDQLMTLIETGVAPRY